MPLNEHGLSREIQEFIRRNIPSIGCLDVLFIFYRNPERTWHADEISRELRTNTSAVNVSLTFLKAAGFLKSSEVNYQFGPQSPELFNSLESFYKIYNERPVAVITFIYEKPSNALKDFADAFKIKKD